MHLNAEYFFLFFFSSLFNPILWSFLARKEKPLQFIMAWSEKVEEKKIIRKKEQTPLGNNNNNNIQYIIKAR